MRAGEMKYRLQLLKPTATTNDYGEEATTYEPIRTVWAERKKQSGNRSEEVGELAERAHRCSVEICHKIAQTARFGRSFAKDAVREQSAFKQSVAPGAPFIPSRIFSRVCVTSP